jgi:hypothetical protein
MNMSLQIITIQGHFLPSMMNVLAVTISHVGSILCAVNKSANDVPSVRLLTAEREI